MIQIVAEIGQNHNGDMDLARRLVRVAAECGADVVKFQKRNVGAELSAELDASPYASPHAYGSTYGEHRRALELTWEQHAELQDHALRCGVGYLVTVCDLPSLEFCPLELDAYKVASRDLTNIPLLEALALRRKPVYLSCGMGATSDMDAAVSLLGDLVTLVHCTSAYPCPLEHCHLARIDTYRQRYNRPVGFSDHTQGLTAAVAAAGMGIVYLEKHFTLDRGAKGSDHAGSLEPREFARLVRMVRQVEAATGSPDLGRLECVEAARAKLAKSLTCRRDLEPGDVMEEADLELRCPGTGIPWADRASIVGRVAREFIPRNSTLKRSAFGERLHCGIGLDWEPAPAESGVPRCQ